MSDLNYFLLIIGVSAVAGLIAKLFFGLIGTAIIGGVWFGFLLGVIVKNSLFMRNPYHDLNYLFEKKPELREEIKNMLNEE